MTSPSPYHWICVCGSSGTGEQAAQRHSKTCGRMGWPWTNPQCPQKARP